MEALAVCGDVTDIGGGIAWPRCSSTPATKGKTDAGSAPMPKTNKTFTNLNLTEMNNLKLNKLNQISDEMKNAVRGGEPVVCSCKCQYANQGGSSTNDNGWANNANGYNPGGEWFIVLDEVVIYG